MHLRPLLAIEVQIATGMKTRPGDAYQRATLPHTLDLRHHSLRDQCSLQLHTHVQAALNGYRWRCIGNRDLTNRRR